MDGPFLPVPPTGLPLLKAPDGALVRPAQATRGALGLGAPGAGVTADAMDGIEGIDLEGHTVLEGLRTGAGACSNILASPHQLRRELLGPGGSVLETVLVSGRPPGVIVQWVAAAGVGLALDLAWRHPSPRGTWTASGNTLRVESVDGATLHVLVPAPERWSVEPGPDGLAVRARVRGADGAVSLLVVRGRDAELQRRLDGLARPALHEARAESGMEEARRDFLALESGIPDLDEGLEWAKAALRAAARPASLRGPDLRQPNLRGPDHRWHATTGLSDPGAPPWLLMGLLAAGEHAAARALLPARVTGPGDLLALAETVRWTGDTGLVRERIHDLDAAVGALLHGPVPAGDDRILLRAALTGAADAVEAAGFRLRAAAWRQSIPGPGEARTEGAAPPVGGRSLPMLSSQPPSPLAAGTAGLGAVLLPDGARFAEPPTPPPDAMARGIRAWALFNAGRPDAGYLHLRRHLEVQSRDAFVAPPAAAALAACTVSYGLLGARPDAAYGRLRLAPAFPSNWTRITARNLRIGDALLDLTYQRDGGSHAFVLTPRGGRVPATVVFEPSLAMEEGSGGRGVEGARGVDGDPTVEVGRAPAVEVGPAPAVEVDGAPAEIDVERQGDRWTIRVQLPVDRERSVVVSR